MAKSYTQEGIFWKNMATHSLMIVAVTAVIVLLLPHSSTPTYDYQLDHPWQYSKLIADSEIPLYKSEDVLQRERDSLLKDYEPYYNMSRAVSEQQLRKFTDKYRDGLPGLSKSYAAYVAKRLRTAYTIGIIPADIAQKGNADSTMHIRVVNGNTATSVPVHAFMSPKQAYQWLFDDPIMQKQRLALQHCNLNEYLEPNIIYDANRTSEEQNDMLSTIPVASGMLQAGQKIIDRGEMVTEESQIAISAYIRDRQQRTTSNTELFSTYGGQFLFVLIMVTIYTMYLMLYRRDYFDKKRSIAMLYSLIIIMPAMVSLVMQHHFFSVYILPLCMAPIFVRVFMDSRTAFITHFIIVMLSALAVQKPFDFIAIETTGGLIAIYTLRELSKRAQVFTAALTVSLTELLVFVAIELIYMTQKTDIDFSLSYHFVAKAVLLLLTYPLMYVVEKAFGFVSAVTLFELSDTNRSLLRRLSEVAPGTFQHSIMVGNLAAEIATRIGAKALLVRVGALYHDIGKMRHPVFFTENQAGVNPHKRISETESAQVVISHVTEGLRMAEKENLPTVIQDFIRTHHGQGMARFFYVQYKNNHPDEEVDDELFTYPGPNPLTREQAILMIADTVEAASRSLTEYTEESITALVNKLVDSLVSQNFFHDCPITFRDLQTAKEVLIERLKSIYHTRIAYPELKKQ